MNNINSVNITGNLTRDPEVRSDVPVCKIRVAVNGSRKVSEGNWVQDANFFDVLIYGSQGENCAKFLKKGDPVGISGRLEHQTWQAKDGSNRERVCVVASMVQFMAKSEKPISTSPIEESEVVPF